MLQLTLTRDVFSMLRVATVTEAGGHGTVCGRAERILEKVSDKTFFY